MHPRALSFTSSGIRRRSPRCVVRLFRHPAGRPAPLLRAGSAYYAERRRGDPRRSGGGQVFPERKKRRQTTPTAALGQPGLAFVVPPRRPRLPSPHSSSGPLAIERLTPCCADRRSHTRSPGSAELATVDVRLRTLLPARYAYSGRVAARSSRRRLRSFHALLSVRTPSVAQPSHSATTVLPTAPLEFDRKVLDPSLFDAVVGSCRRHSRAGALRPSAYMPSAADHSGSTSSSPSDPSARPRRHRRPAFTSLRDDSCAARRVPWTAPRTRTAPRTARRDRHHDGLPIRDGLVPPSHGHAGPTASAKSRCDSHRQASPPPVPVPGDHAT